MKFRKSLMYHTIIKKNNNNSNKKKSIQNLIKSIEFRFRIYRWKAAIRKENKFAITDLYKFSIFSNSFIITNKEKSVQI